MLGVRQASSVEGAFTKDVVESLGITDGERSDLPELVVRFLHRIDEFFCDTDEETQKLAEEFMKEALREHE